MIKMTLTVLLAAGILSLSQHDAAAARRGPGGGGGAGGGVRGGLNAGGISRPSMGSANIGRPSLGSANLSRPSLGSANLSRPSANLSRPSLGNANISRPSLGTANIGRPSLGNTNIGRPALGGAGSSQPSLNSSSIGRALNLNNNNPTRSSIGNLNPGAVNSGRSPILSNNGNNNSPIRSSLGNLNPGTANPGRLPILNNNDSNRPFLGNLNPGAATTGRSPILSNNSNNNNPLRPSLGNQNPGTIDSGRSPIVNNTFDRASAFAPSRSSTSPQLNNRLDGQPLDLQSRTRLNNSPNNSPNLDTARSNRNGLERGNSGQNWGGQNWNGLDRQHAHGNQPGFDNISRANGNLHNGNFHRDVFSPYRPYHGNWYHGCWTQNQGWSHHWHGYPGAWWGYGFAANLATSWLPWSWGYGTYSNPYCTSVIPVDNAVIDYSLPLANWQPQAQVLALRPEQFDFQNQPPQPAPQDPLPQTSRHLDAARDAFARNDYAAALTHVNKAIPGAPHDATLHELRALSLFAAGQYQQAAEAVYAVLAVGPGWNWETMSSLYPPGETYTQQLRALEAYRLKHLNEAGPRFLLAYHYITTGHPDAAIPELQAVVKLLPDNPLAGQLLKALTGEKQTVPPPQPGAAVPLGNPAPPETPPLPSRPTKPITATDLVGAWKAGRTDGSAFQLDLGQDARFTWKFTRDGKTQEFSGTYVLADNFLILKAAEGNTLVGEVSPLPGNQFNFRLTSDNSTDPGLTFGK